MTEEIFDVCNDSDEVIGQAPRSQVHRERWLHRAVHIWVWDSEGRLLVHLRSASKDEYPGCYTSSASGHLNSGENYESAAHRELMEELGLAGALACLTKLPAGEDTAFEHSVLYELHTDATPTPDRSEIAGMEFLYPAEIAARIEATPEKFTPPFRSLFRWWQNVHLDRH